LGLRSTGFVEGHNLTVDYRWAEGRNDKLPELTADLVRRQVAVIVAPTTPAVLVAKAATKTIPIVFFTAGDPVDLGLVASLSRPDSNLTGATTLTLEVGPKWLQLLHEMVPHATSIALLINPTSPNLAEAQSRVLEAAARSRALQLPVLQASTDQHFDSAFARVAQLGASGLVRKPQNAQQLLKGNAHSTAERAIWRAVAMTRRRPLPGPASRRAQDP
jgi:putative tryptophan/tyrosine transport system substrate-binding protein